MSNRAMSWAIEVRGLPWASKGVLMLLADCHNSSTGQCNPSELWLAEKTGLAPRSVRMHLKVLEEAKLIDRHYKHGGRGVGRSVAGFGLKIGISDAIKAPQNDTHSIPDFATAEFCHGKETSLPRQYIAKPYKEEPERTVKDKGRSDHLAGRPDHFEAGWKIYQSSPLKAMKQTKKLARAQWDRAIKRGEPEDILKAIQAEVDLRRSPEGFVPALPDMHRWLRDDCWKDVLRDRGPQPVEAPTAEAIRAAMRDWVDTGRWLLSAWSPPPDDPGCRVDPGLLRYAAKLKLVGGTKS